MNKERSECNETNGERPSAQRANFEEHRALLFLCSCPIRIFQNGGPDGRTAPCESSSATATSELTSAIAYAVLWEPPDETFSHDAKVSGSLGISTG